MKKKFKTAAALVVAIVACLVIYGTIYADDPNEPEDTNTIVADANSVAGANTVATEPNQPAPRKIVMPKGVKKPPRVKCPAHGIVTNSILKLDIDGVVHTYCKKCAMQLVVDFFDENLPELINENP